MPGTLLSRIWASNPAIHAPARYRRACQYHAFVPIELHTLDLRISGELAGLITEAERAVKQLNDEGGLALAPLARLLLRTESIASSKVEGMQVGVRELARAETRAESGNKTGSTAAEILANIDAMTLAVDQAADTEWFSEAEIVAIHERLLGQSSQQHIAGKIRDNQNWIGGNDYTPCGADFVPPPPESLDTLLSDLCASINDETLPPLVQAALVHAQFETIHPFDDGNGRTGRALAHVVLRRRGVAPHFLPPISLIFAKDKNRYISGLTAFRGEDVLKWIEQFAEATFSAAKLAQSYLAAVQTLQEFWREQLRAVAAPPRTDSVAWTIINLLPARPMISAPVAVAATNRAKSRVYEAIDQLTAAGVLVPLTTGARNRWWEANGLLDLIARLEAGDFAR
ncbi:MAG: Fic family protein [Phycisphaerae bacterium]|nr:Fic family protein [Gemmatimonadaceae bacterium]